MSQVSYHTVVLHGTKVSISDGCPKSHITQWHYKGQKSVFLMDVPSLISHSGTTRDKSRYFWWMSQVTYHTVTLQGKKFSISDGCSKSHITQWHCKGQKTVFLMDVWSHISHSDSARDKIQYFWWMSQVLYHTVVLQGTKVSISDGCPKSYITQWKCKGQKSVFLMDVPSLISHSGIARDKSQYFWWMSQVSYHTMAL